MNKNLIIPFIEGVKDYNEPPKESAVLEINEINWASPESYAPPTKVFIWHDNVNLYITYIVIENYVKAVAQNDNEKVSKDACVEFFLSFDDSGYYNIEANCCGKILMSHRKERKLNVEYAEPDVLKKIKRYPSLGYDPIEGRNLDKDWSLTLIIPHEVFFKHDIRMFKGLKFKGNFYKCGDDLPNPHFLSWKKIGTVYPDFHRPEFFGNLYCAE